MKSIVNPTQCNIMHNLSITLIILLCLISKLNSLTPFIYGMASGTTNTYDDSIITAFETSIKITYQFSFKTQPQIAYGYAEFRDYSTFNKIHFLLKKGDVNMVEATLKFQYQSSANSYTMSIRVRYFAWDTAIYNTIFIRHLSISLPVNVGSQNKFVPLETGLTNLKADCLINGMKNYISEPVSNMVLLQCTQSLYNSTHFAVSIVTGSTAFDPSRNKTVTVSVLSVYDSLKFVSEKNFLMSNHPSYLSHQIPINLINTYYMIGFSTFVRLARAVEAMLKDNDTAIDTSYTYDSVFFAYFIFNLTSSTPQINIYKFKGHTLYNNFSFYYQNIQHPQNKSLNHFNFDNTYFQGVSYNGTKDPGKMQIELKYKNQFDINGIMILGYWWNHTGVEDQIKLKIKIPRISKVKLDLLTGQMFITILNAKNSDNLTADNYTLEHSLSKESFASSTDQVSLCVILANNSKTKYVLELQTNATLKIQIEIGIFKLEFVEVVLKTRSVKIGLSGLGSLQSLQRQNFKVQNQFKVRSIALNSSIHTLNLNLEPNQLLNGVQLSYVSPSTYYSFTLTGVKIFSTSISKIQSLGFNQLLVQFNNPSNRDIKIQEVSCSPSFIIPHSIQLNTTNNTFTVKANYTQTVEGQTVSFIFSLQNQVYQHIITASLVSDVPLIFWEANDLKYYSYNIKICQILQYLYISIFVISLISVKMSGVETIFLIQLFYYSFIPIGIYRSSSLMSFAEMKYVSGWNPFFSEYSHTKISNNYLFMGFKSNFISNVNAMMGVIVVCPLMYCVLYLLSKMSTDYRFKPRFLKLSKTFLLEIPLSLFLFNSFNVFISFVINIQAVKFSDIMSFSASVLCVVSIVVVVVILGVFQNRYYYQFNKQLNETMNLFCIGTRLSTRMRKVYPLLLSAQFIITPILLSIQSLFSYSIYIVLAIIVAVSIYSSIVFPYSTRKDNIRLVIHRMFIIFIIAIQSYVKLTTSTKQSTPTFNSAYPWVMFITLFLAFLFNGSYILWKTYIWWKKPGIVNMQLFVQQKGTTRKSIPVDYVPTPQGHSFPKIQYGLGFIMKRKRDNPNSQQISKQIQKQLLQIKKQLNSNIHKHNNQQ